MMLTLTEDNFHILGIFKFYEKFKIVKIGGVARAEKCASLARPTNTTPWLANDHSTDSSTGNRSGSVPQSERDYVNGVHSVRNVRSLLAVRVSKPN